MSHPLANVVALDEPDTFTLGEWLDLTNAPDQPEPAPRQPPSRPDPLPLLAELLRPPGWWADAACRGAGPALWFPEGPAPGVNGHEAIDRARAICAGCSVKAECEAAGRAERHGIWGGRSVAQRRSAA